MKRIILAGTGRSGTTIAADVLNASRRFRYLFEPLHAAEMREFEDLRPREFLAHDSDAPQLRKTFERLFNDEIGSDWTDRHPIPRHYDTLLLKIVRGNLLLGWLVRNFPDIRLLLNLRHPLAVADSRLRFHWPIKLETYSNQKLLSARYLQPFQTVMENCTTPFERHVAAWCIETLIPLIELEPEQYHLFLYEDLVNTPEDTLVRAGQYLGETFGRIELAALERPSEVTSTASIVGLSLGNDITTKWRSRFTPAEIARGFEIVRQFRLESLYGEENDLPDQARIQEARTFLQQFYSKPSSVGTVMEKSHPVTKPLRVLAYGPYAAWQLHGLWEMTLLHGLRVRGAEVNYLLCDGLFSDCDLHWKATAPRTPVACLQCQAKTASLAASLSMEYTWLGRYLPPGKLQEAREWAASIPPEELRTCHYGEWEIGEWVRSSVHSHLRDAMLDVNNPEVVPAYRSYIASGLTAAFAFEALFNEYQPDVMLALNGRFSSIRIAFELAKKRGIRLVAHERGRTRESIVMNHGPNGDLAPYHQMWEDWGSIPLNRTELDEIIGFLQDRRQAKWQSYYSFSPPEGEVEDLQKALNLSPDRPVWAVFPSSDDESAGSPERNLPFKDQDEWLIRTLAWAALHPEIDMVVRAHPNIKGHFRGVNRRQLDMLQELKDNAPANVRFIMPDEKLSTYTLMDIATVGLVFRSTAGLEMATLGKKVVIGAGGWYTGRPFVSSVERVEDFEHILDRHLDTPINYHDHNIQVGALRFAHAAFFKRNIPFPLIKMNDPHTGSPAYSSLEELAPGRDPGLDRACRIVLEGESICLPPTDTDRKRSDADERTLLGGNVDTLSTGQIEDDSIQPPEAGPVRAALEMAERGMVRAAIARLERLKDEPTYADQAALALEQVSRA